MAVCSAAPTPTKLPSSQPLLKIFFNQPHHSTAPTPEAPLKKARKEKKKGKKSKAPQSTDEMEATGAASAKAEEGSDSDAEAPTEGANGGAADTESDAAAGGLTVDRGWLRKSTCLLPQPFPHPPRSPPPFPQL